MAFGSLNSYNAPFYPKGPNRNKKSCECGMGLVHEDILCLVHGEVLRCGHCNSLIWFDETFWPDMENYYIRWSKMDGCKPLKISIWMMRYLFDAELPKRQEDSNVGREVPSTS